MARIPFSPDVNMSDKLKKSTAPLEVSDETPLDLLELRAQIDQVDEDILMLLSRRFSLTEEVGRYKAEHGLEAEDGAREAKQYKQLKRLAQDLALPDGIEKQLWEIIMNHVKSRHDEISM